MVGIAGILQTGGHCFTVFTFKFKLYNWSHRSLACRGVALAGRAYSRISLSQRELDAAVDANFAGGCFSASTARGLRLSMHPVGVIRVTAFAGANSEGEGGGPGSSQRDGDWRDSGAGGTG